MLLQLKKSFYRLLKNLFKAKRSAAIDAFDLVKRFAPNYKYELYVNNTGKLIFRDKNFYSEVAGIMDWNSEAKEILLIDSSVVVTDLILKNNRHDL